MWFLEVSDFICWNKSWAWSKAWCFFCCRVQKVSPDWRRSLEKDISHRNPSKMCRVWFICSATGPDLVKEKIAEKFCVTVFGSGINGPILGNINTTLPCKVFPNGAVCFLWFNFFYSTWGHGGKNECGIGQNKPALQALYCWTWIKLAAELLLLHVGNIRLNWMFCLASSHSHTLNMICILISQMNLQKIEENRHRQRRFWRLPRLKRRHGGFAPVSPRQFLTRTGGYLDLLRPRAEILQVLMNPLLKSRHTGKSLCTSRNTRTLSDWELRRQNRNTSDICFRQKSMASLVCRSQGAWLDKRLWLFSQHKRQNEQQINVLFFRKAIKISVSVAH